MTANEPVRPTQAANIVAATVVTTEPIVHFFKRSRVINAGTRLGVFHAGKISAVFTGVKGIPIFADSTFGIAQARRGWATQDDIINAWPAEKMLGFLKK